MQVDVVIVSDGKTKELKSTTNNCIQSLHRSESNIEFEVIIIESNEKATYKNCKIIRPSTKFNYNAYLNIGIREGNNEFVSFCNNDIIFHPGWFSSHLKIFRSNPNIHSLSPKCPKKGDDVYKCHKEFKKGIYPGYKTRFHVAGWCITARRSIFDIIGKLNESAIFHYSDDNYSMQLKKKNLVHALDADARVTHLFGKSLATIPKEMQIEYTTNQAKNCKRNRVF
ncbi:MAG: glycosyltransferase family 2 protein [Candidatus Thorarchaeota archaeon]|jgi:GT2 family glycosyltransferase